MSNRTGAETPAEMVNRAATTIKNAAHAQRGAELDHHALGSLALALERALDAVFAVNSNLGAQLTHHGEGRRPRTDTDRGPEEVLAAAMDHGRTLDIALRQARQAAHSMAGEFARLAVPPDPDDLVDGR